LVQQLGAGGGGSWGVEDGLRGRERERSFTMRGGGDPSPRFVKRDLLHTQTRPTRYVKETYELVY
jgi:hypothetical protein